MTMLRVLTVDDELLALRRLKLLMQTMPNVDHVGEASNCDEALSRINELRPNVVLLDIKMRDGSGFHVAEAVAERPNPPAIVFVTAFDQFAARAFDSAVVDYLLKPVERERLSRALNRAQDRLKASDAEQRVDELQQILRNLRAAPRAKGDPAYETEFWLRSSNGMIRVPVDAIDYVGSADEYISIHTPSGAHLMRGSIRQFTHRVEPGLFVRIHRRWLVKRSAIAGLSTGAIGKPEVVLRNGQRLPAGRVHVKNLRQMVRSALHGSTSGVESYPGPS
ncbi:MAG TPA: LytTR family DNA-binding domain-containing protein [Sphingomicrobium sp.]|nr:LytTR family DNA-binding domain-containing protein [Sphingomicrobium sp.]